MKRMPKASILSRPVSAMARNSPDFWARNAWLWISVAASIFRVLDWRIALHPDTGAFTGGRLLQSSRQYF
jgi:hypothetical protein